MTSMDKHVAVCDGCGVEGRLKSSYVPVALSIGIGGQSTAIGGYAYSKPDDWHRVGGKDFCSWGCVAKFAEKQAAS
jgi:hypothetical protein